MSTRAPPTSSRRPLVAALLLAASLGSGCSKQAIESSRHAFEGAGKDETDTPGEGAEGSSTPGRATPELSDELTGWARIGSMVDEAVRILVGGAGEEQVAQLAQRWCDVEPEAKQTPHGPVRVCFPDPPVSAGGEVFTLELSTGGVIGLVASELSGPKSEALFREALDRGQQWCEGSWAELSNDADQAEHDAHGDLRTCTVEKGPMLVIGRFPTEPDADLWQVSVAVLRAS